METQSAAYRVRGRVLYAYLALSLVLSVVLVVLLWPSWLTQTPRLPLPDAVFGLTWYLLLFVFLLRPLARSGARRTLLHFQVEPGATRWAIAAGVALLAVSFASIYAVYFPLSYIAPDFVRWWLIDDPIVVIWTSGDLYWLANSVNFLVLVLLGPFVEELFFRGLLLPSWASRWSPKRAVVLSSLAFAVLHADILGGFVFGVVAAMAFLNARNLWMPFVMHVTNNALAWLLALGEVVFGGEQPATLRDFQASSWIALPGLAVGVPLLILVLRYMRSPRQPAGAA